MVGSMVDKKVVLAVATVRGEGARDGGRLVVEEATDRAQVKVMVVDMAAGVAVRAVGAVQNCVAISRPLIIALI